MRPRTVLGILFAINLVNYADRQILFVLLPLVKAELAVSDAKLGALASAFMVVYMCAAPVVGWFADRGSRVKWIAGGIGLWSLATAFSGLARGYGQLFAARALVGVGESGYGAVSPSFVAEHFPKERRGGVLALFSMAIPVGSALGYLVGGWIGGRWGWRTACVAAGAPGLLLALLAMRLRDPRTETGAVPTAPPSAKDYAALTRVKSYVATTGAMSAMTFALGGLLVWMPSFLNRTWGLSVSEAGTVFGGITILSGLFGSLLGGWLGDRLLRTTGKAYFIVSGVGLLLAMPAGIAAVLCPSYAGTLILLFIAETLAFLNMGPLNGVIVSVTAPSVRSMAFAANIFVIHALGDALSPTFIGMASDRWGLAPALVGAMTFLGLAGAFCAWGTRHVERDAAEVDRVHAV
ncbi:MAG: MFS transporter [Elusimicrobia bacterium]|nr:MFS transporter [Elusimicrobiota bacterium]